MLAKNKGRMKSAPPNFDSNSLFLYQIEDKYTKSFKNGFLGERMDPQYIEFYEHKKGEKKVNLPVPLYEDHFSTELKDRKFQNKFSNLNIRKLSSISSVDEEVASPLLKNRSESVISETIASELMIKGISPEDSELHERINEERKEERKFQDLQIFLQKTKSTDDDGTDSDQKKIDEWKNAELPSRIGQKRSSTKYLETITVKNISLTNQACLNKAQTSNSKLVGLIDSENEEELIKPDLLTEQNDQNNLFATEKTFKPDGNTARGFETAVIQDLMPFNSTPFSSPEGVEEISPESSLQNDIIKIIENEEECEIQKQTLTSVEKSSVHLANFSGDKDLNVEKYIPTSKENLLSSAQIVNAEQTTLTNKEGQITNLDQNNKGPRMDNTVGFQENRGSPLPTQMNGDLYRTDYTGNRFMNGLQQERGRMEYEAHMNTMTNVLSPVKPQMNNMNVIPGMSPLNTLGGMKTMNEINTMNTMNGMNVMRPLNMNMSQMNQISYNTLNVMNNMAGINNMNNMNNIHNMNNVNALSHLNSHAIGNMGMNGLNKMNTVSLNGMNGMNGMNGIMGGMGRLNVQNERVSVPSYPPPPPPIPLPTLPTLPTLPNPPTPAGAVYNYRANPPNWQNEEERPISEAVSNLLNDHNVDEESKRMIQNVDKLSKDQMGCRLLQKKLDSRNTLITNAIFQQLITHIVEHMNDPFGNYLCQKLFECCSHQELIQVIANVSDHVVKICNNLHGTRSIQKLIERCVHTPELLTRIIDSLTNHVTELVHDINGNHVIQKCLNLLRPPYNEFIFTEIMQNCNKISSHKHGCCVMQKCIDHANLQQKQALVNKIIEYTPELVRDAYGNYVIQYVLDLKDFQANSDISFYLLGSLMQLANEKFSSNVIEKCLESNIDDTKVKMIEEILQAPHYIESLNNQYGNYVIQKALQEAKEPQYSNLVKKLKPELAELKKNEFGRKIYNKLTKSFPELMETKPIVLHKPLPYKIKSKSAKKDKGLMSPLGINGMGEFEEMQEIQMGLNLSPYEVEHLYRKKMGNTFHKNIYMKSSSISPMKQPLHTSIPGHSQQQQHFESAKANGFYCEQAHGSMNHRRHLMFTNEDMSHLGMNITQNGSAHIHMGGNRFEQYSDNNYYRSSGNIPQPWGMGPPFIHSPSLTHTHPKETGYEITGPYIVNPMSGKQKTGEVVGEEEDCCSEELTHGSVREQFVEGSGVDNGNEEGRKHHNINTLFYSN